MRPAASAPPGLARLRALAEAWITYVEAPLFRGGCFWTANLADFDSRPGRVRDALVAHHDRWLALLVEQLREATRRGEIAQLDADLTAFQIDAVLTAANIALRLGQGDAIGKVRRVLAGLLDARASSSP